MLKKKNVLDLINSSKKLKNSISNFSNNNFDELFQLINRLSELFKRYINQVRINIIQSKEIFSFIEKKTNFVQPIISNIIKHNYTYEQLKSLEESINQIKEKNNNNNLNLFNDEQNLNIFLEEAKTLFQSIKQKYKEKIKEWNNYISISISTRNQNDLIKQKTNNKISDLKEYNENTKYYKININNQNLIKERNKSTENKNPINEKRNRTMSLCKSQRYYLKDNSLIKRAVKSTRNNDKIDESQINFFNVNIPNKSHSIYNIGINNEVLLNQYFKSAPKTNKNNMQKKRFYTNEINNIDKNEQKIEKLNKEILYYKNIIKLLSKNKSNINANNNSENSENKILSNKLKIKEKEIISKDRIIQLLNQEINKYKNKNSQKYEYIQSEYEINNNFIKNLRSNNVIRNSYQGCKTESNISNNINYNTSEKKEQNENLNYINKIKYLEKENKLIKSKLSRLIAEVNHKSSNNIEKENILYKKEILELKRQLNNEINKKEDLNKKNEDQKIQYECEMSKINDKRGELSKLLFNKNTEITKMQNEIMIKDKEIENYKSLLSKKESNSSIVEKEKNLIKNYYKKIIKEKESKEVELGSEINLLNEKNGLLFLQNEEKKKEILELNNNIKELEGQLSRKKEEIIKKNKEIKESVNIKNIKNEKVNELKCEIQKLKEENEGLKQFTLKQQKILVENEKKDEKILMLQKEKDTLKQYFINMKIPFPTSQSGNHNQKSDKNKNQKSFESKFTEEDCFNILMQLNEAKKEISSLKKKNEELFKDLENKSLKNDCFNHVSIEKPISIYEEEFDLKKMAKGAKDKNRSQDINIDYPGIQQIKEKYKELDFYYNSLEELVKKMLLSSTCTNKNKTYVYELCKIVGFNDDITSKILNNKIKKGILNLFG